MSVHELNLMASVLLAALTWIVYVMDLSRFFALTLKLIVCPASGWDGVTLSMVIEGD